MTGVEVDTEGATYIPTLSIPAVQPWIATTLFGPYHRTCHKFSFLRAGSWVSPVMATQKVLLMFIPAVRLSVAMLLHQHQQPPRKFCLAAACRGITQAVGGGNTHFCEAKGGEKQTQTQ